MRCSPEHRARAKMLSRTERFIGENLCGPASSNQAELFKQIRRRDNSWMRCLRFGHKLGNAFCE
jgi:hypothetical protein